MRSREKRKLQNDENRSNGSTGIKRLRTDCIKGDSIKSSTGVKPGVRPSDNETSTRSSDVKKRKFFKRPKTKTPEDLKTDSQLVTASKNTAFHPVDDSVSASTGENEVSLRSYKGNQDNVIRCQNTIVNASSKEIIKVAEVNSKDSFTNTPHINSANFSSNWKVLKKKLNEKTKKSKINKTDGVGRSRRIKDKKIVKKTKNNTKAKCESKIWFDDVDDILIDSLKKETQQCEGSNSDTCTSPVKLGAFEGITDIVGMDCEMVGVGEGGKESVLARVSIVNQYGKCIYDKHVKPIEPVTDYRTWVSGIRPEDLKKGEDLYAVLKDVDKILKGRILVGHALENDLKVLFLSHPRRLIRDTSRYKPFRKLFCGRKPALRKLAEKLLTVKVQEEEHNSIEDAQTAMRLYTMYRKEWEKEIKAKRKNKFHLQVRRNQRKKQKETTWTETGH